MKECGQVRWKSNRSQRVPYARFEDRPPIRELISSDTALWRREVISQERREVLDQFEIAEFLSLFRRQFFEPLWRIFARPAHRTGTRSDWGLPQNRRKSTQQTD